MKKKLIKNFSNKFSIKKNFLNEFLKKITINWINKKTKKIFQTRFKFLKDFETNFHKKKFEKNLKTNF